MLASLILWSTLCLGQANADFPDLLVPPPHVGLVPSLAAPPSDLPAAVRVSGGVFLPDVLAAFTAAEVAALWRFPPLAQKALDLAAEDERRECDLRLADSAAAQPSWWDRVRSSAGWLGGGVLVGALVVVLATK